MTYQEFQQKWGDTDPWNLEEEILEEYKNDQFDMWETVGFRDTYMSLIDPSEPYNGVPFKVLRRATTEEFGLICMPAWLIEFENGDQTHCYADEICNHECI